MKNHRTFLHIFLALAGILIILGVSITIILEQLSTQASPSFADARVQVGLIVLGFLINQIGVWSLGNRLLPDRRIYLKLRAETDVFIDLVRNLNEARVSGNESAVATVSEKMHDQIAMLIAAAGQTEAAAESELTKAASSVVSAKKDDEAEITV